MYFSSAFCLIAVDSFVLRANIEDCLILLIEAKKNGLYFIVA